MSEALAIDALVRGNQETRGAVLRWIEAQKTQLLAEKRQDDAQAQENARQAVDAARRREALQEQHKALASDVSSKEREIGAHQVEIGVLQTEKNKREPVVKGLFEQTQMEDRRLKELLEESEQQRVRQEQQLAELERGIAMYQRLGLFFEHSGAGRVVVRFTQIDESRPDREFSFRMTIDQESDRYIVDKCSEAVLPLDDLVAELNRSGDLPLFIRAMRRQFKLFV